MWQDSEAVVIDHLSYVVSDTEGDHTLIASDDFIKSNVIFGDKAIEVRSLLNNICAPFMEFYFCYYF